MSCLTNPKQRIKNILFLCTSFWLIAIFPGWRTGSGSCHGKDSPTHSANCWYLSQYENVIKPRTMTVSVVNINDDSGIVCTHSCLLCLHSFQSHIIPAGFPVRHLELYDTKFPESAVQTPIMWSFTHIFYYIFIDLHRPRGYFPCGEGCGLVFNKVNSWNCS